MTREYKRLKTVPEFDEWIKERQRNMQAIAGRGCRISKIEAMRLIAKDNKGIELNQEIIRKLKRLKV